MRGKASGTAPALGISQRYLWNGQEGRQVRARAAARGGHIRKVSNRCIPCSTSTHFFAPNFTRRVKFAIDTETNDPVAIKILDKEKIQKQNMGNQIKKEISIMKVRALAVLLALLLLTPRCCSHCCCC
jgi:hypothetical protein